MSPTDIRLQSAASVAMSGLFTWMLTTYVFRGSIPIQAKEAVDALAPAVVGYVFTHIALNKMPPRYMSLLKQRLRSRNVTVLPDVNAFPEPIIPAENPTVDDNPSAPQGGVGS